MSSPPLSPSKKVSFSQQNVTVVIPSAARARGENDSNVSIAEPPITSFRPAVKPKQTSSSFPASDRRKEEITLDRTSSNLSNIDGGAYGARALEVSPSLTFGLNGQTVAESLFGVEHSNPSSPKVLRASIRETEDLLAKSGLARSKSTTFAQPEGVATGTKGSMANKKKAPRSPPLVGSKVKAITEQSLRKNSLAVIENNQKQGEGLEERPLAESSSVAAGLEASGVFVRRSSSAVLETISRSNSSAAAAADSSSPGNTQQAAVILKKKCGGTISGKALGTWTNAVGLGKGNIPTHELPGAERKRKLYGYDEKIASSLAEYESYVKEETDGEKAEKSGWKPKPKSKKRVPLNVVYDVIQRYRSSHIKDKKDRETLMEKMELVHKIEHPREDWERPWQDRGKEEEHARKIAELEGFSKHTGMYRMFDPRAVKGWEEAEYFDDRGDPEALYSPRTLLRIRTVKVEKREQKLQRRKQRFHEFLEWQMKEDPEAAILDKGELLEDMEADDFADFRSNSSSESSADEKDFDQIEGVEPMVPPWKPGDDECGSDTDGEAAARDETKKTGDDGNNHFRSAFADSHRRSKKRFEAVEAAISKSKRGKLEAYDHQKQFDENPFRSGSAEPTPVQKQLERNSKRPHSAFGATNKSAFTNQNRKLNLRADEKMALLSKKGSDLKAVQTLSRVISSDFVNSVSFVELGGSGGANSRAGGGLKKAMSSKFSSMRKLKAQATHPETKASVAGSPDKQIQLAEAQGDVVTNIDRAQFRFKKCGGTDMTRSTPNPRPASATSIRGNHHQVSPSTTTSTSSSSSVLAQAQHVAELARIEKRNAAKAKMAQRIFRGPAEGGWKDPLDRLVIKKRSAGEAKANGTTAGLGTSNTSSLSSSSLADTFSAFQDIAWAKVED